MKIKPNAEQAAALPATKLAAKPGATGGPAVGKSGPNVTTEPVKSQPSTAIPAKADASAKIELSSTAATLLSTGSTPEFDAAKVAAISKAIDDGSYKVNPEAIADKLLANAQELLSKTSSNSKA
jgi:negative regulator of flagellin synthesis FlgM